MNQCALSLVLIIRDFIWGCYFGMINHDIFQYLFTFFFLPRKKKNELPWNFYKEITQPFETFFVMISGLESNYVLEL